MGMISPVVIPPVIPKQEISSPLYVVHNKERGLPIHPSEPTIIGQQVQGVQLQLQSFILLQFIF